MLFPDGIVAQPDVLAQSAKTLREAIPHLPRPGVADVIALVGIGASEHAARSAAAVWRDQGLRAFAVSASELQSSTTHGADILVGLSESGRSAETVAALGRATGATRIGVTNFADSPVAEVTEHLLEL
ncbi:MAG: SIS domain-containing protein, partial [Dermatophilaceae bacterium]|nr:SIS domain-containing protein [Dermatophilaceae bacterium]